MFESLFQGNPCEIHYTYPIVLVVILPHSWRISEQTSMLNLKNDLLLCCVERIVVRKWDTVRECLF